MEERRISRLYLANAQKSVRNLFGAEFRRSRAFPILVLAVALVIPAALWYAHTKALFHKTRERINNDPQPVATAGPGGRDPLMLTRPLTAGAELPQLQSAELLPGLGLSIVQLTAALPGRGAMPLLVAPSEQELVDGTGPRVGPNDDHGALEVPWGGLLTGLHAIVGSSLMLDYNGDTFNVPLDTRGNPSAAEGGLLLTRDADAATVLPTGDGAVMNGSFNDTDFDGHWRSKTHIDVQVTLHGASMDLAATVKNNGESPEPMGIGWHPRFRIPGSRGAALLRLPAGEMLEVADRSKELPSGKVVPASETLNRFVAAPAALRTSELDDALVRLRPGGVAGPATEVRFPEAGYGLRLTAVSPSIQELRVYAPENGDYVSLGFQTNYDNPLTRNWDRTDSAIVVLQPGQSLEYRVRLEIFPIAAQPGR